MHEHADWNVMVWKTVAWLRVYPDIGPVRALQAVAQSEFERAFFADLLSVRRNDDLQQFLAEVLRTVQTQTYRDTLVSGALAGAPSS